MGDLRAYGLVQFYSLVAIAVMLWRQPARYTLGYLYWIALSFYGLAKLLELTDAPIFELTEVVSGHTLKHVAAALSAAGFCISQSR